MSRKVSHSNFILFDGYCPESKLQGKIVEMRINSEDFWESPATGLQMTTFPPFAAVLSWRGKGKFCSESPEAWKLFEKGLMLCKACDPPNEIFPDKEALITSFEELRAHLMRVI